LEDLIVVFARFYLISNKKKAETGFCTGTAVGVAPVGTITYQDRR
jgi:branched-subunit amino acid aminotransferase/4-amino-4-deoxychorismate lyase